MSSGNPSARPRGVVCSGTSLGHVRRVPRPVGVGIRECALTSDRASMERRGTAANGRRARAFTLIELLISIAIVGVLLAILLPTLGHTIGAARGFRCQVSLRSVAF